MPLTPQAGVVRLRALQIGKESTFKTQVAATRRLPWTFAPTVDPHWTFPAVDTGTLDAAIAPYRTAEDDTGAATTPALAFNDMPYLFSAGVKGGVTGSAGGTSYSWAYAPASTSQDTFDTYTLEWFDDATADAWAGTGGVVNDFTLTYPQDMGPIALSANWRLAKSVYPATPTVGLSVDASPTYAFCADTEIYVNDSFGTIETSKLSDAVYDASIQINNNLDLKRWANGSNTRFQIQNYGRGERVVTFTINGAKTSSWIAEATKWIAASPSERFLGFKTTSVVNADTNIPYSLDVRIPGYWITRADTTINSNTGFSLTGHQVYDTTATYPFKITVVNTLAAL